MKDIYAMLADLNVRVAEVAAAVRRVEAAQANGRPERMRGPVDLTLTLPGGPQHLPPRQRDVLSLLLDGQGEKQVAIELGLSRNTVHHYVKAIYRHYGVSARSELLAIGIRSATAGASSTPQAGPPPPARPQVGARRIARTGTVHSRGD